MDGGKGGQTLSLQEREGENRKQSANLETDFPLTKNEFFFEQFELLKVEHPNEIWTPFSAIECVLVQLRNTFMLSGAEKLQGYDVIFI